jgi:uncharacterized membrane protein/glutaredoxin
MATSTLSRPPTRSSRRAARRAARGRVVQPPLPRDPVVIVASVVGLLVSAYLAIVDFAGGSTLCLAGSDCDAVRASAYGHVAGLPVAALGAGYFLAVLLVAAIRTRWQPRLLQVLGGAGLGAAVVFVGLQGLILRAWCPYCLVADTAALAIGLRALWPEPARSTPGALSRGIVGAALAVAVLALGYAANPVGAANPGTADAGATTSQGSGFSQDQLAALADHLRESGAVFYGAYWCPHCQAQKQMFGAAASSLPYVECDPRGTGAQPAACQAAGVRAYPTWVIGGQTLEGEVSPADLARLSGFSG